jgi:HK97 family phage portal protein
MRMADSVVGTLTRGRITVSGQPSSGMGTNLSPAWAKLMGFSLPDGVASVSERDALAVHAYFACLKCISEDMARHVWYVAKPIGHEEYEPLWDHPVSRLLNWRPNPEMSSYAYHEAQTFNYLHRGNSFAEKEMDPMGLRWLWPVPTAWCSLRREESGPMAGRLVVDVSMERGGVKIGVPYEAFVHLRNLSDDGLWGMDVRALHAGTTLATASKMGTFLARLAHNLFRPSAILKIPISMYDSDQGRQIATKAVEMMGSGSNVGKVVPVEKEMELVPWQMDLDAAQFEQLRGRSPSEITALFRCPPHKIGDLSRSTNNNIEAQDTQYNTETLGPQRGRCEGEFTKLVWDEGLVVLSDEWELLRGSFVARSQAIERYIRVGLLSKNEGRVMEGRRRVEHPAMDTYQFDVNTVPHDQQAAVVKARIGKAGAGGTGDGGAGAGAGSRVGAAELNQVRRRELLHKFIPAVRAAVARSLVVERDRLGREARDRSGGDDYIRRGEEVLQALAGGFGDSVRPVLEAAAGVLGLPQHRATEMADAMATAMGQLHAHESRAKLVHQRAKPWDDAEIKQESDRRAVVMIEAAAARWVDCEG